MSVWSASVASCIDKYKELYKDCEFVDDITKAPLDKELATKADDAELREYGGSQDLMLEATWAWRFTAACLREAFDGLFKLPLLLAR